MAANSNIQWTDASWNCVVGCEAVSPGCAHCYAATMTRRLEAMGQKDYIGLTTAKHFNGKVRCLPHKLNIPLHWHKRRRVFVNSMSDLFHEDVPDEFIDKVFAVMALAYWHTFQVLTKRADRMFRYMSRPNVRFHIECRAKEIEIARGKHPVNAYFDTEYWPFKNVWLGVSAEDQQRADERIPWLLKTPAAVRFVSVEPLLGPVSFRWAKWQPFGKNPGDTTNELDGLRKLDWIIVGGESGPGARECNVAWIRSIVEQSKAADVPCFVKQLGALPFDSEVDYPTCDHAHCKNGAFHLKDKKGGDIEEFPSDLRIRQFPSTEATHA